MKEIVLDPCQKCGHAKLDHTRHLGSGRRGCTAHWGDSNNECKCYGWEEKRPLTQISND